MRRLRSALQRDERRKGKGNDERWPLEEGACDREGVGGSEIKPQKGNRDSSLKKKREGSELDCRSPQRGGREPSLIPVLKKSTPRGWERENVHGEGVKGFLAKRKGAGRQVLPKR